MLRVQCCCRRALIVRCAVGIVCSLGTVGRCRAIPLVRRLYGRRLRRCDLHTPRGCGECLAWHAGSLGLSWGGTLVVLLLLLLLLLLLVLLVLLWLSIAVGVPVLLIILSVVLLLLLRRRVQRRSCRVLLRVRGCGDGVRVGCCVRLGALDAARHTGGLSV
jgi:hypothetical protein